MDKITGAEYLCTINNFRLDTCLRPVCASRRYDEQIHLSAPAEGMIPQAGFRLRLNKHFIFPKRINHVQTVSPSPARRTASSQGQPGSEVIAWINFPVLNINVLSIIFA
jgi:hypothetical protein